MGKYRTIFWMPNGFANEGTYIYGLSVNIKQFLDNYYTPGQGNYCLSSNHNRLDTAKNIAEKQAQKDINRQSRIVNIGVAPVTDYI